MSNNREKKIILINIKDVHHFYKVAIEQKSFKAISKIEPCKIEPCKIEETKFFQVHLFITKRVFYNIINALYVKGLDYKLPF